MTQSITLDDNACRGCGFCVDECPTDVLAMTDDGEKAEIVAADNCIGCYSCVYLCPSLAIQHEGFHLVPNFYRTLPHSRRLERFL